MTHIRPAATFIALAFVFLLPLPSRAADSDGVVTGTGRVTIKRPPQVLRGQFVVIGQAKDVAGAVAKLKEAQAEASKKLAELGAAEKSVEFGPTPMGAGPADAAAPYTKYMQDMQRMMSPTGGGIKPAAKPQVVIVSSTVKAEWPLKAAGADELFVAGYCLQEKIKAAAVGKPDAKKMTPEEAEALEEAAGAKGGGGAGGAAGEPTFQYVCMVSDADRAAARAEAFQKAKQNAAETAKAAGAELAALRNITAQAASPTAVEGGSEMFTRAIMQQMAGPAGTAAGEPSPDEASGPAPAPVALQITVTASFAVK